MDVKVEGRRVEVKREAKARQVDVEAVGRRVEVQKGSRAAADPDVEAAGRRVKVQKGRVSLTIWTLERCDEQRKSKGVPKHVELFFIRYL